MKNHKILIYTGKYLLDKGIAATIKDILNKFELHFASSLENLKNQIHNNRFDFIFIDIYSYEKLINPIFSNYIEHSKIIIIQTNIDSTKHKISQEIININNSKSEIYNILNNIFIQEEENEKNNEILSEREKDIVRLIALGLTNKEIAEKLFLSIHTVTTHRKNISNKLGIKSISGLTIYAIINGIISIDKKNK
jgi:DNA-binding CsgD family transcriptional regulator